MKKIEWKLLTPKQIEVRPQFLEQGKKDKLLLLLYQDARCAMDGFDEQFGEFGWKCDYKQVGEKVYGCIAVWDEDKKMWIEKWDTGDESNIAADKGQASDILKRCAVKWGFARELYTSPRMVVDNDGYDCRGYRVSKINYDENRKINALTIVNRFGKVVYTYGQENVENTPVSAPNKDKSNLDILTEFCSGKKKEQGINLNCLRKFYEFYKTRATEWKGTIQPEKLWTSWEAREKKAA